MKSEAEFQAHAGKVFLRTSFHSQATAQQILIRVNLFPAGKIPSVILKFVSRLCHKLSAINGSHAGRYPGFLPVTSQFKFTVRCVWKAGDSEPDTRGVVQNYHVYI